MSKNINVMALDDGYGDIKYDSNGIPSLFPSFVTKFKQKPRDDFSNNMEKGLDYIASKIKGEKYVIGDYAMKLDPNIRWIGGEKKHDDYRFPILLKTALGLMAPKESITIDTLMMNLPIRYDTLERRAKLISLAEGEHRVGISLTGNHFQEKVIKVKNVEVKKQPFGSLCDIILNNQGDIVNTDIAKGFNVVVDIGARTLNILTLQALEEQPELTLQSNDGMFAAYSEIGNYLESKLDVIIPDGKLPQIIQDKEIKNKDITPLINQVFSNHANNLLSILDKTLISSWGFVTSIIFTGGGSEILRPYLENSLKNVNTVFLDRFSNVRGLRKYGIRQSKKNMKNNIDVRVGYYGNKQ